MSNSNATIKYKIVAASNAAMLEVRVNEWIEKGWEPFGSVTIDKCGRSDYMQSMIRKGEK